MTPLGSPLPDVTLPDLDENLVNIHEYADGNPILIVISANHCPYVQWVESELGAVVSRHPAVRVVAISPNDVEEYPDDAPVGLRQQVERAGWTFPYLVDESQDAARTFGAACTPDFFLYASDGRLAYRGAFDTSTPKNGNPLNGELLDAALTEVEAGRDVPEPHRPSMGCSVKWKQS